MWSHLKHDFFHALHEILHLAGCLVDTALNLSDLHHRLWLRLIPFLLENLGSSDDLRRYLPRCHGFWRHDLPFKWGILALNEELDVRVIQIIHVDYHRIEMLFTIEEIETWIECTLFKLFSGTLQCLHLLLSSLKLQGIWKLLHLEQLSHSVGLCSLTARWSLIFVVQRHHLKLSEVELHWRRLLRQLLLQVVLTSGDGLAAEVELLIVGRSLKHFVNWF